MALGLYIFAAFTAFVLFLWSVWVGRLWHYEAFGLVAFVVFIGHWGWTFVAFTAFVAFLRHSAWSFYFYLFSYSFCGVA